MKFLRLSEVLNRTGLSRSTLYALMAAGHFPKNVSLMPRVVVWVEQEIDDWMLEKIAERDEQQAKKQTKLTCAA